jgi:hypothetical protein
MRTGHRTKGTREYDWAWADIREGQVTCRDSWIRWSLFSLIAAVLALIVAATTSAAPVAPARLVPLDLS